MNSLSSEAKSWIPIRLPVSPHRYPYIQFSILLNAIIISLGSVKYSLSVQFLSCLLLRKSSLMHISFLCRLNCLVSLLFLVVIPCLCNSESSLHLVVVSSFICLFRVQSLCLSAFRDDFSCTISKLNYSIRSGVSLLKNIILNPILKIIFNIC